MHMSSLPILYPSEQTGSHSSQSFPPLKYISIFIKSPATPPIITTVTWQLHVNSSHDGHRPDVNEASRWNSHNSDNDFSIKRHTIDIFQRNDWNGIDIICTGCPYCHGDHYVCIDRLAIVNVHDALNQLIEGWEYRCVPMPWSHWAELAGNFSWRRCTKHWSLGW